MKYSRKKKHKPIKKEKVDLSQVEGTGPAGRATKEDLELVMSRSSPTKAIKIKREESLPGTEEIIPLRGTRRTISQYMRRSKDKAAHYTYFDEVRVTVNGEYNSTMKAAQGDDISVKGAYAATGGSAGGAHAVVRVYGGSGGDATVRVQLARGSDVSSVYGERSYHFEKGETARIEIPLNLEGSVWYDHVQVYINGERY